MSRILGQLFEGHVVVFLLLFAVDNPNAKIFLVKKFVIEQSKVARRPNEKCPGPLTEA